MTVKINVKSRSRSEMIDITSLIQKEVLQSGVKEGLCVIYVPHTTAGVTINEGADPSVCDDILNKLNRLIPQDEGYRHMEGNSDSHIKASNPLPCQHRRKRRQKPHQNPPGSVFQQPSLKPERTVLRKRMTTKRRRKCLCSVFNVKRR